MSHRPEDCDSTELYEMARTHFNEPIICSEEVVRLIGYAETAVDCYLICSRMRGEIFWHSCVGGYIFLDRLDRLKGQGRVVPSSGDGVWDDLYRLDNVLHLNGAERQPEFQLILKHDDDECFDYVPDLNV